MEASAATSCAQEAALVAAAEEDLDGNLVTGYAAAAFLAYFNLYAPFRVPALPSFSFPLFFICQSIQDSIGEEKIKNYRNLISIVLEISYLTNLSFSSYSLTFSLSLYLHLFCISLSLYSRIRFLSCQSLSGVSPHTTVEAHDRRLRQGPKRRRVSSF